MRASYGYCMHGTEHRPIKKKKPGNSLSCTLPPPPPQGTHDFKHS